MSEFVIPKSIKRSSINNSNCETNKTTFNNKNSYTPPEWSAKSTTPFFLQVIKDGSIIEEFDLSSKPYHTLGRQPDVSDILLSHASISRKHAVIQSDCDSRLTIYDLKSTHGTFILPYQHIDIHVGDFLSFGESTRKYLIEGPQQLLPPEKRVITSDNHEKYPVKKLETHSYNDISDENISEEEEITDFHEFISYHKEKIGLSKKQETQLNKYHGKFRKIKHLKTEIDKMHLKESSTELTQGQQNALSRNAILLEKETQLLEEMEESIRDSIRNRKKSKSDTAIIKKKKSHDSDSSDDDFYDRTKKKHKVSEVENQYTLEKKLNEINETIKTIQTKIENTKNSTNNIDNTQKDELEIYMTSLNHDVIDQNISKLQNELDNKEKEKEKLQKLLKIVNPTFSPTNSHITSSFTRINPSIMTSKKQSITSESTVSEQLHLEKVQPSKQQIKNTSTSIPDKQKKVSDIKESILNPTLPLRPPEEVFSSTILPSPSNIDDLSSITIKTPLGINPENISRYIPTDIIEKGGLVHPNPQNKKKYLINSNETQEGSNDGNYSEWVPPSSESQERLESLKRKLGY